MNRKFGRVIRAIGLAAATVATASLLTVGSAAPASATEPCTKWTMGGLNLYNTAWWGHSCWANAGEVNGTFKDIRYIEPGNNEGYVLYETSTSSRPSKRYFHKYERVLLPNHFVDSVTVTKIVIY